MTRVKTAMGLFLFFGIMTWSGINPHDRFTWTLEVFPSWIAFVVLVLTNKKFPLTDLAYGLILIHCTILFVGGHYTYAEVPLFDWIRDWLHQSRNNYDKLGHLAQGFVPAVVIREILIRKRVVKRRSWLFFLVFSVCLSISALYELFEWFVAVATGSGADAFLGSQGDIWDTQSDMLMAAIGAVAAQVFLGRIHDRQIAQKDVL